MRRIILSFVFFLTLGLSLSAQHNHDHDHADHSGHNHATEAHDSHAGHDHAAGAHDGHAHGTDGGHDEVNECGFLIHPEFDAGKNAVHHIGDANVFSIGPFQIPLPCMVYVPGEGFDFFSSSVFEGDSHGDGKYAYNGFILHGGVLRRVADSGFPREKVMISKGFQYKQIEAKEAKEATATEPAQEEVKAQLVTQVCYNKSAYDADHQSTADLGVFGGGITSFYDFSISKNVVSMLLMAIFLGWIFLTMARYYKKNEGVAPKGITNFMEPMVLFIKEEVADPYLGHKSTKFLPYLLSIFFFILALNLFGQIPFFGNANVTGNFAVTMALAVITFLVTNLNGNGHYWKHLFIAPGMPLYVKIILVPVELMGLFIKPITLMLRLFGNITAGHMVILIFVSFIFIFGKSGEDYLGAGAGLFGATLLSLFMMMIELIVAFVQAFVFTILTASYIGDAVQEDHH